MFFHLHCNTHDIPDKERFYSTPGNDFIDFTDNLQYSGSFRDTLNQSSMVYGN